MNEKYLEFYDYLKSENLTDLDAESFQSAYSEPEKYEELWGYVSENNLTDLSKEDFFESYFGGVKKKEETVTDFVSEPGSLVSPEPQVPVAETVVEEEVVQPVVADATRVEEPALPIEQIEQPDLEELVVYEDPGAEIVAEAEGEKNTWVEDFAGKNFVTDFFGDMYRAVAAGQAQGGSVDESLELMTKGKDVTDEDIEDFIAAQERMASQGESDEMKEFNKIYEANGSGWLGFLMGTGNNPSILPQLFVSSVSAMLTPATLAAGAAGAGTGAAIGATGFSAGPLGAFTTLGGTLAGAMGAMGTTLETGLAFSEFLQEQLEKKGLEMTTEGIRKVLEDPEAIKSMRYRAAGRGITIGAFNAVTAGVGSQVVKSVAKATGRKFVAGLAGAGVEVVSESTGEVAGRLVAGQEMDVAEIGFEGFAGGPAQLVGITRGLLKSPTYKINNETVSGPKIADFIKNAPIEDLTGATLEIKNDPVLKDIAVERRENARMDAIIKAELTKAGITDEGAVTALTKLEKERRGLEGNGTRAAQQRLAEVNKEIDGLMDGAKIAYTETVDASGDKVTTEVIVTKEYAKEELIKDGIESPTEQQVEAKQAELFEEAMEAVQKPQEDAIQEPSPETVDAPEPTRGSEEVGEGVPDIGEPTAEVEAEDQVAEAAPTAEVAVEEGAEVELEVTKTDKKGRTLKFFKTTTEKDGVKTTRFTFNRSDKSPEQRSTSKTTPVEEALGGLYEVEVPEGLQENGAVPVAVTEVRESESGASASVIFEQDGQRFEDEVVLTPKTQEAAPVVEETVSAPTQGVTEEEQVDIDDFFSDKEIEGVDKVADNLVVNRKQLSEDKAETAQDERKISRIKQIAKKAAVSLKKEFPDVRIVLHETEGQYKRFAGKRARGAYVKDDKTKTIHINLSIADLSTVPHEVFHALILEAAATDPQALVIARNMLESVRKVVDPNSEMSKAIEKFVAKYEDIPVIQDEEYLAELMGILSSQYRTLDKPSKNTVKEFLRKLAKLVGIDTKFGLDEFFGPEFLERDEQVIDLLNTISGKVSKGQFIEAADVKTMGNILAEATPAEQAQAQREVRDFKRKERERKAAEEKGIMARQQIVGERASLEDDVRDGLDMARWTYIEQGDSKKVRREVKAAWGWEKGADGKWRYEIETGELKKVPNGTYKLSDVYDAPELYKAYPEAKDISLTINVRDSGAEESWFMIDKNAVEINVKNYGRVRPDLIHELQHYIQFKEGFAIGGNTNTAIDLINSLSPDKLREINILEGKESAMNMLSDIAEESELTYVDDLKSIDTIEDFLNRNTRDANLLNSLYGDDAASYVLGVLNEDLIDLEDGDLMGGIYQVLQTIQEQTENKDGRSIWSPYAVYQRLIGEVEARNAAFRDGGGRSLIEDSEDTPREDQLAVFGEQEKVLRKIEAKEEMTEQELDALDLAKLPAQEGSYKGAGLFYGPRATIANYEYAKTMFADGVPAEDIEMLTGWNVVEKENGDVVYVLSRNEVQSKDAIDKAIASRKDRGMGPRQQVQEKLIQRSQAASNFTDEQLTAFAKEGILFHGSDMQKEFFDSRFIKEFNYGYGFYFTGVPALARKYGDKLSFVDTKQFNLLDGDEDITQEDAQDMLDNLPGYGLDNEFVEEFLQDYIDDEGFENDPQTWSMFITEYISDYESKAEIFSEYLESELGFDGMTTVESAGKGAVPTVAVVWNFDLLNDNVLQDPTKEKVIEEEAPKEVTRKEEATKDVLDFVSLVSKGTSEDVIYLNKRQQVEGINPKDVRMRSRSGNRVGKGLSVKKVNNEAVVEEIPDLTLDYVRENAPASYLKNANLIAQYPLVRGVKNFDDVSTLEQADEVYEVYARQVADNLNWIMESYPEEYREISTLWYDGANKIANELAADYGVSPEQVAGIIASLSPQNDWYQNVRAAELLLLAFRENPVMSQKMIDYQVNYAEGKINKLRERIESAGEEKGKSQAKAKVAKFKAVEAKNLKAIADAEALLDLLRSYKGKRMEDAPDALKPYYVRLYNEVNQPKSYPIISPDGNYGSDALTDAGGKRKFGWGSYTEIGKGVSIRLDGSQENISVTLGQMHKIRNFFNNIIDPMSKEKDITMDTHAIAAALLIPASSKTKEVVQNFGTGTANSGVKGQKGLYYANQAGYFLSAEENNMLPRQVQSVTWEAVRGLFTSKFKDGAKNVKSINDIWENYAEGNITIEQARQEVLEKADGINAPSWAGLISDESRDGDGTTTERGRGKRGGPATEREGVAPRQQVADIDKKISNLKARQTKASEAEYKRDKAGKPSYSKAFFAEDDKFRKEIERLELLKLGLAPAYEQRVKVSEELDELNKPFEREVGNKYYPRLGTVSKGEMTGEDSDLGGIYEAEVDGYLFRGVSVEDYNRIKKEGFIDTDLRGAISDKEGINLTPYSATAFNYLPEGVEGVVMAMKVSDKSGLFMIGADDYVRSSKPIPFTDVEFVTTPVIEGRYLSVKDGKSTPIAIKKVSHPSKKTEPDVAPRQQVVYHVAIRDNKGNIQKKGLEKDRPPTFAKGVMGTAVFDTAGKSFAFSNLEDATKWGIKTKIEKDKEVSIVVVNAEGKNLQEDKAVTEDPFNPLSSAVFTEDVISPSDILSIEDVDYKFGKPFDKNGQPLTEESFDIKEDIAPRQQVIEDVTAKELDTPLDRQQRVFRSGDLENKAEPRWMFQSGRGTGHFGTGFYFFGTKEQADEYDARDVSEIDIDKYNLAKATKKLHDALKDINTQYNEYYEVEAINELKKEPFRQAVPAFFIEEVAKAAGMGVISEAELEAAATEVTKALTKDGNPAFGDSVSTLVMKALGFEGVNAVGTRMDNSTYGTVIYDLKGDIAPRQQLSDIATPLPRQQKSVREVVQQARDNNFKDAATKDFLKRKGVPTADIDKAIKTLDDVYARVMKEIDGVITKSQKRGVDFDTQLKNALAYLQGTKLYEDTTDIHREKLMREVRAKFDKKEKRAPSAKRILGNIKDVKKVTLSEKEALKMQLRLVAKTAKTTARALVVAGNELTKSLKEMVKGGVITANQMSSVLRRFSRVDLFNPASIDSFLDYMAKIFADAEYGAKIARIKKLLPRAKKNIKSKIGVADVLGDTLTKLFNVNPTLIPMEMLEDYQNLLEMMGAAKKVLPLADINDVTEMANKLLNAVYEEVSMAEDLAEVFANYENKVIKDGKVDYAATIEAMIADQTISLEEAAVMRKYKSRIVEPTKKEPKTEEELAEERAELMSAVDAAKVNVSRLVMDEERTLARQLAKLMRTEAIERLSNQQLETLLAVIDNINNGFVTHAAQRLVEAMNASNRAGSFLDSIVKAVPLPVSTFVGKIKAGITKNNKFFESVKRNPLAYIDQVFGDFQTTRIYDAIFKPLAKAYDTFSLEMKRVDERLTNAQEAVLKSFKNDPNKARMSSYKMMAYMLQREFEANPDNKQVNPAADFIRATIDHINKGQSFFKGKDAEMLQQILDDFGGEQIDSQKLYDSFNKAERNALAVMEDINKSMGSKAVFTGAVIRGRRVDALNQYAHHNVLSTSGQMDKSADVSLIEAYNQSMRASTKAKNLIERTGAATPLNFDVFSSVSRGSRFTLTDFYLTEPIRTSRKTISDTRKLLEERGDVTKQENEIINAVENALELTLDDLLTRTFSQSTMLENVIQYVKKTGYRLVLASGTRAIAEWTSNVSFAAIYAPKDFAVGKANKTVLGAVGIDVMSNLKSTQLSRMYPNEVLSGRMIDTSVLGEKAGDKGGRAKSDVLNKATQIYNGLLAPAKKGVEWVADTLISYPDKAVIRPLWFGSFENAFVEITGKKPDFEKIAANDEAYMAANQEALNKATDTADQLTTLAGAADNPFKSMLRGKYPSKAKQTALLQFFNNFNSFMTRFLIYEYISARTAVNAMLGNGMISKRQGAALLGAVTTRMIVYTLAGTVLNQIMKQVFGLDEEEDEKDIMKQFGQSLASTATSLIVGRDFGNVVKGLLNYGVENLNEEFLDELRDGDYDPYRDAIAYTFVPPDREYKSNTLSDYIRNLMGPFGPFYKMAEFGVKTLSADEKKDPAARIRQQRELNERLPLELLGNLGLIPLYRDIRSLLLADIYKGMGKEKKGSSTGMTKAEKAQMKEYFPEMYEMQMQMEEDMKNPELERMMKEQEKAIEEMMKGLK